MVKQARKNANGTGGKPYQDARGRWVADITVGWTSTGARQRKRVYGRSAGHVTDLVRGILNRRDDGTLVIGATPTLDAWTRHWLEVILPAAGRKPNTIRGYRGKLSPWVWGTPLGRMQVKKVRAEHVEALYQRMYDEGLSSTSVLQMHRILHRAFKVAFQRGFVGSNPVDKLDAPSPAKFAAKPFPLAEARALFQAACDEGDARAAFSLIFGPRQAERIGLGWDDVDLKTGRVQFTRALNRVTYTHGCGDTPCGKAQARSCPARVGGPEFDTLKSDSGSRQVIMPKQLTEVMRRHRAAQMAARTPRWAPFTDRHGVTVDLVFAQPSGRPHTGKEDLALWHRFLAEHGAEQVRTHDARHTAASVLLALGVDPRVVMDQMGWSQAAMLKRYQHVMDELREEVASKLEAAMSVPAEPSRPEPPKVVSMAAFKARRSGA